MTAPTSGLDLSTYLVTDTALCGARGVPAVVADAVRGGVTCVQVRHKAGDGREFLALVQAVVEAAGGVPVLVNDRIDVALAARARGLPVAACTSGRTTCPHPPCGTCCGRALSSGLSISRPGELDQVHDWPTSTVDYLGVGPVQATATKPGHTAPTGVDGAARLAAATRLPCVAIGGLDAQLAGPLRRAGLAGAAYVSAICASSSPEHTARTLSAAWARGSSATERSERGHRQRAAGPASGGQP